MYLWYSNKIHTKKKESPEVGVKLRDLEVDDDKTEDVFDSGKETKLDEVGTKVLGEGDCADVSNKDLSIPVYSELVGSGTNNLSEESLEIDCFTFLRGRPTNLCTYVQSSWANC